MIYPMSVGYERPKILENLRKVDIIFPQDLKDLVRGQITTIRYVSLSIFFVASSCCTFDQIFFHFCCFYRSMLNHNAQMRPSLEGICEGIFSTKPSGLVLTDGSSSVRSPTHQAWPVEEKRKLWPDAYGVIDHEVPTSLREATIRHLLSSLNLCDIYQDTSTPHGTSSKETEDCAAPAE